MELVQVEILTQAITSQYGVLSAGDILRTSPAFARHLVKEANAAKYVNPEDDKEPPAISLGPDRAALDAALADLPGQNTDPDYVVRAMRSHFGDVFTDADEAAVREAVKPNTGKPSDGLTVAELRAALEAKDVAIPDGAKKPELVALLDATVQP